MKKIIILSFFIILSCAKDTQNIGSNNYGYVYDTVSRKPIKGVIVKDVNNPNNKTITDIGGNFLFLNVMI